MESIDLNADAKTCALKANEECERALEYEKAIKAKIVPDESLNKRWSQSEEESQRLLKLADSQAWKIGDDFKPGQKTPLAYSEDLNECTLDLRNCRQESNEDLDIPCEVKTFWRHVAGLSKDTPNQCEDKTSIKYEVEGAIKFALPQLKIAWHGDFWQETLSIFDAETKFTVEKLYLASKALAEIMPENEANMIVGGIVADQLNKVFASVRKT